MTCLTPLASSMYVDGALEGDAFAALEQHLGACAVCRQRVGELRAERLALRAVLMAEDATAVPAFVPPVRNRPVAVGAGLALAIAAAASAFWQGLVAAAPSGLHWLNPFSSGELIQSSLGITTFLIKEGSAMLSSILNSVVAALAVALFSWGALALLRRRAATAALLLVVVVGVALPTPGHALDIRRNEKGLVTLAAGETIDDTLIAAGVTVVIDGDVNGDLFAFGRTITIRGKVAGNVIAAGETITIEGTVGGSILAASRGIELPSARVARNLYGFGRDIEVGKDSDISGNAVTFGDSIEIAGRVGIDAMSFGSRIIVSGNVVDDVDAFARSIELLPSARVGGNLTTRTESVDAVQIAEGAVVSGSIERLGVEREQRRNRYATVGFYVGQVVKLGAAFLAGLLLLWLFPALRTLTLPGAVAALRSAGIGLATAVTLPIVALLACFTIVGLPIGLAAFVVGALGLYLAKPVIGQLIGRLLFRGQGREPHHAVTLLAGLAIVVVATSVPFVGPIVGFAVTIIGFGMMVSLIFARLGGDSK